MFTVQIDATPRLFAIDTAGQGGGAAAGHETFVRTLRTRGDSSSSCKSPFAPGTDPRAAKVMETCCASGRKIRLIFGNTLTGESHLDDHGVVGRVVRVVWVGQIGQIGQIGPFGCSADSPDSPETLVLIEPGESDGRAIPCESLLAIIDWAFGECLYRHPAYREAELHIEFCDGADRPWQVLRRDKVVACFQDIGKAGAYLAFMRGASVEPRVFR